MSTTSLALVLTAVALASAASASPQCGTWGPQFARGGFDGPVHATAVFDDGSGARLFAGGFFSKAGGVAALNVAVWDGAGWSSVPGGVSGGVVRCMASFDDGAGPALYVGGRLGSNGPLLERGVARWDGANWTQLADLSSSDPFAPDVRALAVYRENGVERLFAAGTFTTLNGVVTHGIARWDGSTWSSVGGGMSTSVGSALVVFDDGAGPSLYLGGNFLSVGGAANTRGIARWNGSSWSSVGGGVTAPFGLNALAVFDSGAGAELYAGGVFSSIGGAPISTVARWDSSAWRGLGNGVGGPNPVVSAFAVLDSGSGPELYCGGTFDSVHNAGGLPAAADNLARWNGSTWTGITPGPADAPATTLAPPQVTSLATFGAQLAVGGVFESAGDVYARNFAFFDGARWSNAGPQRGFDERVYALLDVTEPALGVGVYAGGDFHTSGSGPSRGVARWDGAEWSALGGGAEGSVRALTLFDMGSGPELIAGGAFASAGGQSANNIAAWDGANWRQLGAGLNGMVRALAVFNDGIDTALYAGGAFTSAGGAPAAGIARWNGSSWSAVGPPFAFSTGNGLAEINALAVFTDASGSGLYAGGKFDSIGAAPVQHLARWNGVVWSALGATQVSQRVRALAVHDDGTGAALYVGGQFSTAGGIPVGGLARWQSGAWTGLGSGAPGADGPRCFATYSHGSTNVLVAGGDFTALDGVPLARLAQWNGNAWSAFNGGASGALNALAFSKLGGVPAMFAGGAFTTVANTVEAQHIARWSDPCSCGSQSYCSAGTTSSGCLPSIRGEGIPSASASSGFTIHIDAVEGQRVGHIAYSVSGSIASPWSPLSTSFLCIKAPTQRTPVQSSNGLVGACDGGFALDWNAFVAASPACLGAPFSAGDQVWAQGYFRDPPAAKSTNLSNALNFTVCP